MKERILKRHVFFTINVKSCRICLRAYHFLPRNELNNRKIRQRRKPENPIENTIGK